MRTFLVLLGTLLFTVGCGNNKNTNVTTNVSTDSVLLVFNHPTADKLPADSEVGATILGASFLSFMSPSGLPSFLDKSDIKDTLKLVTIDGYLEVAHLYRNVQYIYFYLKGGDTVTFSYNELGQPIAESALSPELTRQYNFARNIEGASNDLGLSPDAMFKSMKYKPQLIYQLYTDFLANYSKALHEARSSGALNPVYLDYYDYQYRVEQNKYIGCSAARNDFPQIDTVLYKPFVLNDTLTKYISYYYSPLAFYTKGGANFNVVASDTSLPPHSKKLILYNILRIWHMPGFIKSPEQIEPYYGTFLSVTADTAALEQLKSEFSYLYAAPEGISTGDMVLTDTEGGTTTLESVLAKHKGKVVYVDFWASWCGPCIGTMPAALQLREEYKGKNVVFVYLGFNDRRDAWKSAVKKHRTDYLGENYLIMNQDADLLSKLKLKQIPWYIIYDKTGKLVNPNAPRPGDQEIKAELNKYL